MDKIVSITKDSTKKPDLFGVFPPLSERKPGWLFRVLGAEVGVLLACDARWSGENWTRGNLFNFLYKSRRNTFFLLTDSVTISVLTNEEARRKYDELPEKIQSAVQAFKSEPLYETVKKNYSEDKRIYKVVRNDKWEVSVWLDYKPLPCGWFHIGITGPKTECLDFIRRSCVFGAVNPGIP